MTLDYVAAGSVARLVGYIIPTLVCWVAGLGLLIAGLRRRSAARKQPTSGPGYPPTPGSPPPGDPAQYPPPGYPSPPGQPGLPPYGGYPQRPPPKSSGIVMIVIGAVLLVVGVLSIPGLVMYSGGTSSSGGASNSGPAVGDCLGDAPSGRPDTELKHVDCSSPDAIWQLAAIANDNTACPDGKRDGSIYKLVISGSTTFCLAANFTEGVCYFHDRGQDVYTHEDCSDLRANFKVVKRVDGSTDTSICPPGSRAGSFPQPPRTFCFQTNNG
jgi:hypothetical protein